MSLFVWALFTYLFFYFPFPLLSIRLAQLVKLMMVLAILGSYAVQFYVPMEIMWPSISRNFETSRQKLMAEYAFRTLLVLVTCK